MKKALREFVNKCREKFGENLISIVFFGSIIKGYAKADSDFDLLIVAKNLPDIKERFELVSKLETKIWDKYKIKISSILVEPEEIFEPINPLLFGVLSGYKILFGKENFKSQLEKAKAWIEKLDPVYVEGEKEWRVKNLL